MKRWFAAFSLALTVSAGAMAAPKGPEINLVDNKLSINVEAIPISRLLYLVDMATGMKSKVPPELANRNISAKFSNLEISDAVRKMFQGQPFDYVVLPGQGIVVTAASQIVSSPSGGDFAQPQYNQPVDVRQMDQPFVQEFPPVGGAPPFQQFPQGQQQQQPAMIQTPFGPIQNNRAGQQQAPNGPLNGPGQQGQQNSLFPQANPNPFGQPQQPQVMPGLQQGNPNPFGTPNTFGGQNQPVIQNQNNNLFGNTTT